MITLLNKHNKSKKIISILLLIVICFSFIKPVFADTNRVTSQQVINGSPLLNDSWTPNLGELTKEDHIAFALYMSANTIPFLDNYLTGFFENQGGTNGSSKDAIVFRAEKNPTIEKYISMFASYHQELQSVRGTAIGTASNVSFTPLNQNLNSLFRYEGSDSYSEITGYEKNSGSAKDSYINFQSLKIEANLQGEGGVTQNKVIYDGSNIINRAGLLCAYSIASNYDGATTRQFIKDNIYQPLYLDCFGNIIVHTRSNEIRIVLPNYLNTNITNNRLCLLTNYALNIIKPKIGVFSEKAQSHSIALISKDNAQTFYNDTIDFAFNSGEDWFDSTKKAEGLKGTDFINCFYWMVSTNFQEANLFEKNNSNSYNCVFFTNSSWSKEGANYILNKHIFLNYILMAFGQFKNQSSDANNTTIKIDTDYFNINVTTLNNTLALIDNTSHEDKVKGIVSTVYGFLSTPLKLVNFLASIFQGLFVWLYKVSVGLGGENLQSTNTVGFTTVQELPFVSGIFYALNNYTQEFFGFLFIIFLLLALFKKSPSIIIKFILTMFIIMILPGIFNYITYTTNNLITKAFSSQQNYWILEFNKSFDKKQLNSEQDVLYEQNNFNGNATLKYIVEKSPVVINNTSDEMVDMLTSSGWGYLFLSSILRQFKTNNIISSPLEDVFKKFSLLKYSSIDSANMSEFISGNVVSSNYYDRKFYTKSLASFNSNTGGEATYSANTDTSTGTQLSFPEHLKSFSSIQTQKDGKLIPVEEAQLEEVNTLRLHKDFFYLPNIQLTSSNPYSVRQDVSVSGLEQLYNKYFVDRSEGGVSIPKFNFYDSSMYDKGYGYFILTENVLPYFYLVYRDLFRDEVNHRMIGYQLQGEVTSSGEVNSLGIGGSSKVLLDKTAKSNINQVYSRNTILMEPGNGTQNIVDYADLRTLFKKVVPYCYSLTLASRKTFPLGQRAQGSGDDISLINDDYPIYRNNPKYWLFDCNWAVNLMDLYYANDSEVTARSATKFCPGEINVAEGNATDFERLCAEFYYNLTPQIEELVSNITDKDMNADILIRQMAMITALQFNKSFSMGSINLEPRYIDPGSISLDTLYKNVILQSGYQDKNKNAAETITDLRDFVNGDAPSAFNFFGVVMLFFSAFSQMILSWLKMGGISICVIVCIVVLIIRIASDSNQDYLNTIIGVFALYARVLLFSYIGVLVTLFLSLPVSESGIWRASELPLNIKLALIAFASVVSCKLVLYSIMDATGISFQDGHFSIDPESALQLGGNKVRERLSHAINSGINSVKRGFGWMGKGAAITGAGLAIGGADFATHGVLHKTVGKTLGEAAQTMKENLPNALAQAAISRFLPQTMRNPMMRKIGRAISQGAIQNPTMDTSATTTDTSSTTTSTE